MLSSQHIARAGRASTGTGERIYRSYEGHQYHRFPRANLWAGTVGYAVTLTMGHIVNKLRRI